MDTPRIEDEPTIIVDYGVGGVETGLPVERNGNYRARDKPEIYVKAHWCAPLSDEEMDALQAHDFQPSNSFKSACERLERLPNQMEDLADEEESPFGELVDLTLDSDDEEIMCLTDSMRAEYDNYLSNKTSSVWAQQRKNALLGPLPDRPPGMLELVRDKRGKPISPPMYYLH